jgi:hypothetical protein
LAARGGTLESRAEGREERVDIGPLRRVFEVEPESLPIPEELPEAEPAREPEREPAEPAR